MEEDHPTHLIIRYLSGETSAEEEKELSHWVSKDSSHKRIFNEYLDVWNQDKTPEPLFDVANGLQRLNQNIDKSEVKRQHQTWRKLAASVAIFLSASILIFFLSKRAITQSPLAHYVEQTTAPGQRSTFTLDDGSLIVLNANSVIKFPKEFEDDKREVFLSGEAFFQVTKDVNRPFLIHTGDVRTQVLGTSFNVKAKSEQVIVSVVSGKVKVIQANTSEELLPQQKIVYSVHNKKMIREEANLEHELAWKNNALIFEDAQLFTAAEMLREFYGVSVEFDKDSLKKCLISGKFKNQPLDVVLEAISFSTGVQYKLSDKRITFFGKGCE